MGCVRLEWYCKAAIDFPQRANITVAIYWLFQAVKFLSFLVMSSFLMQKCPFVVNTIMVVVKTFYCSIRLIIYVLSFFSFQLRSVQPTDVV